MSSSNLEDLSKKVMMMTFSPSPFPRWLTCHGKGDVFYFNEMDIEANSKSGEDTLVWDYPGGEVLGKIDGRMARAIWGPVRRRASLAEDHGLIQPLSGGTDVMQKLQNSLLKEQGRPPREENNRLANTKESVMSNMLPVEIAHAREARFAEGDTAGWEAWMKTQPQSVQDDWQANKEKYGDKFKTASFVMDEEDAWVPTPSHPMAKTVTNLVEDASWHPSYSGRGMYGKSSPLAFTTSVSPGSPVGSKLVKLGFMYDRLGKDFIYYLSHLAKKSNLLPVEIAQLKEAKFSEGDTAGFERWMKTQPQSVQDDWAANKEKYGDQFKTASLQFIPDGTGHIVWDDR